MRIRHQGRRLLRRRRNTQWLSQGHGSADGHAGYHRSSARTCRRPRHDGCSAAFAGIHGSAVMTDVLTKEEIRRRVVALGPWFHNLDLNGVSTAPSHFLGDYPQVKWRRFAGVIPDSLKGMTVLDIGCNAGFYAMEMKRRGADRVLGLDSDDDYLAQARFAAEVNGLKIEFRKLSAYDVAQLGEKFDLVIFMGVLYHFRHPLLAFDLIYEHVARDLLLFQSMLRGSGQVDPVERNYDFWTSGQDRKS